MADIKAEIRSPTIKANVYRATIPDSGENEIYQGEYAVTPSSEEQTLETKGMIMRKDVTVHKIPDDYIIPTGDIDIVKNGEVDISHYKTANVNVPLKYDEGYSEGYDSGYSEGFEASQKTIILQEKTVTENGDVTADEGFTGLSKVNVAIPIKEEQEKSLTITKNGTYSVLPDKNKTLSGVNLEVDVKDETLAEIETTIDERGVLDSTEGTVEEKVNQLIDLVEENKPPENAIYTILEYGENGYPKKVKYQIPQGSDETTIPNYAFGKNGSAVMPILQKIEEVEIPESVINIGINAFSACLYLKKISNYDRLINISNGGFFTAGQHFELKYMPPKIETLGAQAFNGAFRNPGTIIFPETLKSIGSKAFYNTGTENVVFRGIPESLDASAFSGGVKNNIYCPWAEGEVANAPWGATKVTIHYNYVEGEETNAES